MNLTPKTPAILTTSAILIIYLMSGCGTSATPNPTQDPSIFYTQAAATIAMGLTQTSQALPSPTLPLPTSTPKPRATFTEISVSVTPYVIPTPIPLTPSPIPVDPATARGCLNAAFISDVTLKFADNFNPGDKFTKTWRVKNTGTCDWPRGFQLLFVSGDRFGADTAAIDQKVMAGGTADISIAMVAPDSLSGEVYSNWTLANDIGKPFGPVLFAAITLPAENRSPSSAGGCLNSLLESDVSIRSGTELSRNANFTKTWQVKNNGTCEWTGDFKITFVGGDPFGADTTKIRRTVGPGASTEISLNMTAPGNKGTVSSAWQLSSEDGQLFGELFAFTITVK